MRTAGLKASTVRKVHTIRSAQLAERMRAANVWEDHDLVFCQENGRPIDSRADWQEWSRILRVAGIAHAGTHAMRHSAGHGSLVTTRDICTQTPSPSRTRALRSARI
jgi:site-specific recombinase XerD